MIDETHVMYSKPVYIGQDRNNDRYSIKLGEHRSGQNSPVSTSRLGSIPKDTVDSLLTDLDIDSPLWTTYEEYPDLVSHVLSYFHRLNINGTTMENPFWNSILIKMADTSNLFCDNDGYEFVRDYGQDGLYRCGAEGCNMKIIVRHS